MNPDLTPAGWETTPREQQLIKIDLKRKPIVNDVIKPANQKKRNHPDDLKRLTSGEILLKVNDADSVTQADASGKQLLNGAKIQFVTG